MNATARTLAGSALIIIAAAGGFAAYRWASRGSRLTVIAVLPAQAVRAPAAEASVPRPIPEKLPSFTLRDRAGVPRTLANWSGHPLMINFWATWCAPCRHEIPLLRALRRERQVDALEVVGIAVDRRPDVLDYAQHIGIDYPILIGEQEGLDAAAAFGVDSVFPFTIFADRAQRVVAIKVGELHRDEAAFILDRVRELDSGRLQMPAAQAQIAAKLQELAIERAKKEAKRVDREAKVPKRARVG